MKDPNKHDWNQNPTQAECDHWNTLREYEAAHAVWMDTPIHTDAGKAAKATLDVARERYIAAYKANHPDHIVI